MNLLALPARSHHRTRNEIKGFGLHSRDPGPQPPVNPPLTYCKSMTNLPDAQPDVQPHVDRLASNLARAHNLVSIYQVLAGPQPGRRSVVHTDVLRSAVVLIHASLEDFLRSLARTYLPVAAPEVMNTIPLKGLGRGGRAEKILLGNLDQHRGKTVDELIDESVEAFLERSNYNNATEIAALLESLGVDVEPCRRFFPELDKMMARRHQIVHRADCTSETGKGRHQARSLAVTTVEKWINVVSSFQGAVLYQLQLHGAQND